MVRQFFEGWTILQVVLFIGVIASGIGFALTTIKLIAILGLVLAGIFVASLSYEEGGRQ